MVEQAEIERIAKDVVCANTSPDVVVSVSSKEDQGWTGDPILRVSVVIKEGSSDRFRDEIPLKILTELRERLEIAGEARFPILDYATPAELAAEQNISDQ
jgi:hypothetical protein